MTLIFDMGMHHGLDTKFYLDKGFTVVSLEANPNLCNRAERLFSEQIASGQLIIVNKALSERSESRIKFYVNKEKDDWSSTSRAWAEKGEHKVEEILVEATTLKAMVEQYGAPYYIKCDVEGADEIFCQQLTEIVDPPSYVSVEAIGKGLLDNLLKAKYKRFQILNQALNHFVIAPNPSREGKFVEVRFNGHMTGVFGNDLAANKWLDYDECLDRYLLFTTLKQKDPLLAHGWLDFHASR